MGVLILPQWSLVAERLARAWCFTPLCAGRALPSHSWASGTGMLLCWASRVPPQAAEAAAAYGIEMTLRLLSEQVLTAVMLNLPYNRGLFSSPFAWLFREDCKAASCPIAPFH